MALRAAQDALKQSGQSPNQLDLLLYVPTWHQGPDGWMPHSYLQRLLVGGKARAAEVRQGCNGMFTALELAASYLNAVPERHSALLVSADNFGTPLLDRWRTNLGFILGDAASAVVLTKEPGVAEVLSVCCITEPEAEAVHRGGEPLFPPGLTLGRPLDFGARLFYHIEHQTPILGVLGEAQQRMREVADLAVEEAGIGLPDIARVAFMNYSREVVEQRCMETLGIPMERSTWDFGRNIGHCGANDHIVALDHLLATGGLRTGEYLLMLAMGPGVEFVSAVVKAC
jgi:3-oxoacyl-[acyl-carrier-protein] synthase-3/clorobiocin biosynthesis protein CloN2